MANFDYLTNIVNMFYQICVACGSKYVIMLQIEVKKKNNEANLLGKDSKFARFAQICLICLANLPINSSIIFKFAAHFDNFLQIFLIFAKKIILNL